MDEKIRNKIIEYTKNIKKPVTIKQLAADVKVSYTTALKYCDVLSSQGKIKIEDVGNARVIYREIKNAANKIIPKVKRAERENNKDLLLCDR